MLNERELITTIRAQLANWQNAKKAKKTDKNGKNRNQAPQSHRKDRLRAKWLPPPLGFVKINFDGSVLENGGSSAGCVARNEEGKVIHIAVQKGGAASPVLVEARALRLACIEALHLGLDSIILEGDCLTVINAALRFGQGPWEIDLLISDVRNCLAGFREVRINHVFREANQAVDRVASLGH